MHLRVFITFTLFFFVISLFVCNSNKISQTIIEDTTTTINLLSPSNGKKIFYENDTARIEITHEDFIADLETELLNNYSKTIEKINFVNLHFQNNTSLGVISSEDIHRVANLLEMGKASVFNKTSKKYETKILVHTYSYACGPTCGEGYRFFYFVGIFNTRGIKFFEIMDWIA